MALDIGQLLPQMLRAAEAVFGSKWPEIRSYAEGEFKKIGLDILRIEQMSLQGTITKEEATLLLDIQKNASRTVLLTLEGIGLIMAQDAINAALGVIKDVVNTALGFVLL